MDRHILHENKTPYRGVGVFGFGNLLPLSLISNEISQRDTTSLLQTLNDNITANYTHHNHYYSSGRTLTSTSPIGELTEAETSENSTGVRHDSSQNFHSLERNTEEFTDHKTYQTVPRISPQLTNSSLTTNEPGMGFETPTRTSSSSNFMSLEKPLSSSNTFDHADQIPQHARTLDFGDSNLMARVVAKAELGRVIMGIDDI